jgi:hypothetical protein
VVTSARRLSAGVFIHRANPSKDGDAKLRGYDRPVPVKLDALLKRAGKCVSPSSVLSLLPQS